MPAYKYKTFEEAESALWNFRPDEAYFSRVTELWNFANKLCPITYSKGIFKYRNIEEANKQRNEWELDYAKQIQASRNTTRHKRGLPYPGRSAIASGSVTVPLLSIDIKRGIMYWNRKQSA